MPRNMHMHLQEKYRPPKSSMCYGMRSAQADMHDDYFMHMLLQWKVLTLSSFPKTHSYFLWILADIYIIGVLEKMLNYAMPEIDKHTMSKSCTNSKKIANKLSIRIHDDEYVLGETIKSGGKSVVFLYKYPILNSEFLQLTLIHDSVPAGRVFVQNSKHQRPIM